MNQYHVHLGKLSIPLACFFGDTVGESQVYTFKVYEKKINMFRSSIMRTGRVEFTHVGRLT